jgi:hypothetical protein
MPGFVPFCEGGVAMGVLRDRMVREMQLRRFVPGTQQAYVHAVEGLPMH